jgi:hypothetical protein
MVGPLSGDLSIAWQVGDGGLTELPKVRRKDDNLRSGSIAYVTYSDAIMTNGGQISEVKSFSMDTHAKAAGLYNIETAKVLTYTTQNGSHLMGEESYALDVAGNWRRGLDKNDIICVFAKATSDNRIPAFCNKVTARSKLRSVNTAQVETIGSLTAVGSKSDVPAALNYEISVTPDTNSASGYADGIISTTFTVSIKEGRNDGVITDKNGNVTFDRPDYTGWPYWYQVLEPPRGPDAYFNLANYTEFAATLTFIDATTVTGGISSFVKAFDYQSGVACKNC